MKKIAFSVAIASSMTVSTLAGLAKPVTFELNESQNRDVVSFTSDAPIELIVGRTNKITGNVTVDDSFDLAKKPLEATFDVDLASIDTGIPLRNEHMRDNFLETKTYPKATFVLKSLQGQPMILKPGQKMKLMAKGDFTLHGKTVSKLVPVEVTYVKKCAVTDKIMPGCDLLQIRTTFTVPFKDHQIQRPEVVFQKLADNVIVTVAASAWVKGGADKASTPAKKDAKTAG